MRRLGVRFFATLFFISFPLSAGAASSVGFVHDNIWYSQESFFAGDTVRVYSAIFNSATDDIIGTVSFFDNGTVIGSMPFTATAGKLREVWVDWRATSGDHAISARITEAFISKIGSAKVAAPLSDATAEMVSRFVDQDTDGDKVGNQLDADDDNDGVSDVDEIARGADPLVKNSVSAAATSPQGSVSGGGATDTAAIAAASVIEVIDTKAQDLRVPVEREKVRIEGLIAQFEQKENTFTQSKEGALINAATGQDMVAATRPVSTPADTMRRLGLQLYRGVLLVALYVLDHKILLYLVLLFVLYKIARWTLGIFRRRN